MSDAGSKKWIVFIPILFIIAAGSIYLSYPDFSLRLTGYNLLTFWTSFGLGIAGSGVYLVLLLMTEKKLTILENEIIPNLPFMIFLYLLSGGFFSAVMQVSSGIITSSDVNTVFMLGFGWQGALSGVAGAGARAELVKNAILLKEDVEDEKIQKEVIAYSKTRDMEELREAYKKLVEEMLERK